MNCYLISVDYLEEYQVKDWEQKHVEVCRKTNIEKKHEADDLHRVYKYPQVVKTCKEE